MVWRDLSKWQKGAIIFFVIDLIVLIISYVLFQGYMIFTLMYTQFPAYFIMNKLVDYMGATLFLIAGIVTWTVIGGLIGLAFQGKKQIYLAIAGFLILLIIAGISNVAGERKADTAKNEMLTDINFAKQALVTLDSSYCDKISEDTEALRTQCKIEVSAIKNNDVSYCDGASNSFNQVICYEKFAKAKQDLSVCEKLNPNYVAECKQLQSITD